MLSLTRSNFGNRGRVVMLKNIAIVVLVGFVAFTVALITTASSVPAVRPGVVTVGPSQRNAVQRVVVLALALPKDRGAPPPRPKSVDMTATTGLTGLMKTAIAKTPELRF